MTREDARKGYAVVIILASLLTIAASSLVPWFTLTYTPGANHPLDGVNPNGVSNFAFNAVFLIPYLTQIQYLQPLYLYVGLSLLIALLSWIDATFIRRVVLRYLDYGAVLSFIATLVLNVFDKSIVRHMDSNFLMQFYGTTDLNYAISHSTIALNYPGLFMMAMGTAVTSFAIHSPVVPKTPKQWNQMRAATASVVLAVVVSCALCATGQASFTPFTFGHQAPIQFQMYIAVYANQGWQDTHVWADGIEGHHVCIAYLSGTWTVDQSKVLPSDAAGNPPDAPSWLANQPGQPIGGISSQALIGKVGNLAPFVVGNTMGFFTQHSGEIYFRINASDTTLSNGAGYVYMLILVDETEDQDAQYHCPAGQSV